MRLITGYDRKSSSQSTSFMEIVVYDKHGNKIARSNAATFLSKLKENGGKIMQETDVGDMLGTTELTIAIPDDMDAVQRSGVFLSGTYDVVENPL